jgi:hypothetical protein
MKLGHANWRTARTALVNFADSLSLATLMAWGKGQDHAFFGIWRFSFALY